MEKHGVGAKIKNFLSMITVEPIVFCNFLAVAFAGVYSHAGIYEIICVQNFQEKFQVNCAEDLHSRPGVEAMVQQRASTVNMYLSLAYMVPALLSDIFLGAWGDLNGRKVNILIGFVGLTLSAFPYTILLTWPKLSLGILVLANMIAGITGYIAIIMISSLAYLTDIVPDKSTLTVRMAQVMVFTNMAQAVGSFAAGSFLNYVSLVYVVMISEIVLVIGFAYTLVRLRQVPPVVLRREILAKRSAGVTTLDTKVPTPTQFIKEAELKNSKNCCLNNLRFIGRMYKEVWVTFTRNRPGHRRCYLYLMTVIYLLFFIAELGLLHGAVLSLYVFRLGWKAQDLAYWRGVQALIQMFGMSFGSLLLKRVLKLKETTVLLVCLTSGIGFLTITAFANIGWVMYLGVGVGALSTLAIPTIKSFVAQLVDVDEVGKAFTANGVTADLAFVLATLFFNNIYRVSVTYFAGLVFLFAAGLLLICFFIALWVHFDRAKTEPSTGGASEVASKLDKDHVLGPITKL